MCTHIDAMDTSDGIPVVIISTPPIAKNKSIRTNYSCMISILYDHYSHHCQDLAEYRSVLHDLRKHSHESEVTIIKEIQPMASSSNTTTIYMIYTLSSTFPFFTMEDPPDLSRHHFHDDKEIIKNTTSFTPFHLTHSMESVLPIEF